MKLKQSDDPYEALASYVAAIGNLIKDASPRHANSGVTVPEFLRRRAVLSCVNPEDNSFGEDDQIDMAMEALTGDAVNALGPVIAVICGYAKSEFDENGMKIIEKSQGIELAEIVHKSKQASK